MGGAANRLRVNISANLRVASHSFVELFLCSAPIKIGKRQHMAVERTLSIIKPDAVAKNVIGQIYSRFESSGLKVIAAKMVALSRAEAEGFAVHRERPFFRTW